MTALMPEGGLFVCTQQVCIVLQHDMCPIMAAIAICILHELKVISRMEQQVRL